MTDEKPSYRQAANRRLSLKFAWYDLWLGAFYDRAKRVLYVCPLPCVLITYRRGEASDA